MRLLYVNADRGIPLFGTKGASVHVRESVRGFAEQAESVTVVTLRTGSGPGAPTVGGARVRPVPGGGEPGKAASDGPRDFQALAANDAVEAVLEEEVERGVDAIYERYSLGGVAGARVAERHGLPWLLEVNAPLAHEAAQHRGLQVQAVTAYLEDTLWRQADRLIVVSDELRAHAERRGVEPSRIQVLPNGFDADRFFRRSRAVPSEHSGGPVIGFAGSLKPWHGCDVLAAAFPRILARHPDARLRFIGDGPQRVALADQLAALPAGSVEFTGAVPHDDVPGLLRECSVAVAPYPDIRDFYFSPLKIMEYAALGLPIVASRIGQIRDLLEDGCSGLLVPPGDDRALADAVNRILDQPELGRRLGDEAHRALRHRTWRYVTGTAFRLIASTVEERSRNDAPAEGVAL